MKPILFVALLLAAFGCGEAPPPPGGAKARTREAFESAVVGKTSDEVRQLLGKPRATYNYDNGTSAWVYYDLAYDATAAKSVPMQWVAFSKAGVCTGVKF